MTINNEIKNFSNFLNNSFEQIYGISQKIELERRNIVLADKIENGFLQFAWEMIVESVLCTGQDSLVPYGDGADFYGRSSRVTYPDKLATHCIKVHTNNAKDLLLNKISAEKSLDFIKLVTYNGEYYSQKPPFDFVLCDDSDGNRMVYSLSEVNLVLEEISEE